MLSAKKRIWREPRGSGLSETRYKGLELYLGDFDGFVIVSKLSHGYRVLDANDRSKFIFEGEGSDVEISETFYNEVVHAFEADQRFQSQGDEFDTIMG